MTNAEARTESDQPGRPPTGEAFETIRYERLGYVGTLSLARPEKHNAQNPLMWDELSRLGEQLVADQSLRCLVVTGEGPSFSSGIDLVEGLGGAAAAWSERSPDDRSIEHARKSAETFRWISALRCPSVAAVHGHAYGAGLQLALACDLRIFSRGALVGLIETRHGLLPDMGATVRLPRIVGDGRARELILLGEVIDSSEALRIGLANLVVDDEELDAAAAEMANRLASLPPLALRGARRAIDATWDLDGDSSFDVAFQAQVRCLTSEDFGEARRSMADGRNPRWTGR